MKIEMQTRCNFIEVQDRSITILEFITENRSSTKLFNYKTRIHYRESFKYKIVRLQDYASTKPILGGHSSFNNPRRRAVLEDFRQ